MPPLAGSAGEFIRRFSPFFAFRLVEGFDGAFRNLDADHTGRASGAYLWESIATGRIEECGTALLGKRMFFLRRTQIRH